MWSSDLLPEAFARAFEPVPDEPIWKWAETNVWLDGQMAAEPGFYRSAKTPWTRRLQDLIRNPVQMLWSFAEGKWVVVKVTEINEMKSSQSGVSEGVLNGIRHKARFRPCNVIYAIDTRDEARNISNRLLPTLERLEGGDIFTGDDDDLGTFKLSLRAMDVWFFGSFSSGKFANKQAPFVVADELEEHGGEKGDTSTARNLASRKKTAANGMQINISKPKLKNGPIDKAHQRGNQEEWFVPCPHCSEMQWLTFFEEEREVPFGEQWLTVQDEQTGAAFQVWEPAAEGVTRKIKTGRMVFEHCKNHLGEWDRMRILREAHFECGHCKGKIEEHHKERMNERGEWRPTAIGTPGIISQRISDLLSGDTASAWGQLVLEFLDAKREGRRGLQGFYNHRLGLTWREETAKTDEADIRLNIAGKTEGEICPPYKKGTLPFVPWVLLLGSDVGLAYARGAVLAVHPNGDDAAVVDWFDELGPEQIAEQMLKLRYQDPKGGSHLIHFGFMDAKYRKGDCYKACLSVPGFRLIPCAGLGGSAARSRALWGYSHIPNFPRKFKLLTYNDREAKDETYVTRIKKKERRLWLPMDVFHDPRFVAELCAEELVEDENGVQKWDEHPGPNHFGDSVKNGITGLRFLTRDQRGEVAEATAED